MEEKVIVIGAGAAGLMACSALSNRGLDVLLVEKNDMMGKKLLITGKGRCNVTNSCDISDFFVNIPKNSTFLYSALYGYTNKNLMEDLEKNGLALKNERGGRVFPITDRSKDVVDTLCKMGANKAEIMFRTTVKKILIKDGNAVGIETNKGEKIFAKSVIIATGGMSYQGTGSTGDGYTLAKQAGHTITPLKGSLVPFETEEAWVKDAMGLSLKNVSLSVINNSGKIVWNDFGEMLFTHFGLSGPLVLSASAHVNPNEKYTFCIDLKPAIDDSTMYRRICKEMTEFSNKNFENSLNELLPRQIIPIIITLSGIDKYKKCHQITKEERKKLAEIIKGLTLTFKKFRPIEEAIITSGGVSIKEINPSTMESKLLKGLYFAGEVIDVDAYTGGFNLQIAFSTGYLAGENA